MTEGNRYEIGRVPKLDLIRDDDFPGKIEQLNLSLPIGGQGGASDRQAFDCLRRLTKAGRCEDQMNQGEEEPAGGIFGLNEPSEARKTTAWAANAACRA